LSAQAGDGASFRVEIPASTMESVATSAVDMQKQSLMWLLYPRPTPLSQHGALVQGSIKAAEQDGTLAKSTIAVPTAGKYTLWVRYAVHPMRTKAFTVKVQGAIFPFAFKPFGGSQDEKLGVSASDPNLNWEELKEWKEGRAEVYGDQLPEHQMIWTRRELQLKAGSCEVFLAVTPRNELEKGIICHAPEVDSIVITNSVADQP